jgi:hypothetical protein
VGARRGHAEEQGGEKRREQRPSGPTEHARKLARALALAMLAIASAAVAAGCQRDTLDQVDGIFYDFDNGKVLCAANLDAKADNDLDSVTLGLERARDRRELIGIYAHDIGNTVPVEKLEAVLAKIQELGLPYFTYDQLGPDLPRQAGVLLSFDDNIIDHWYPHRDLFQK